MRSEMDCELSRYDAYKAYADLFMKRDMAKEARVFESLADLCFEKAELLRKVEQMIDGWIKTKLPKEGPDSL